MDGKYCAAFSQRNIAQDFTMKEINLQFGDINCIRLAHPIPIILIDLPKIYFINSSSTFLQLQTNRIELTIENGIGWEELRDFSGVVRESSEAWRIDHTMRNMISGVPAIEIFCLTIASGSVNLN